MGRRRQGWFNFNHRGHGIFQTRRDARSNSAGDRERSSRIGYRYDERITHKNAYGNALTVYSQAIKYILAIKYVWNRINVFQN